MAGGGTGPEICTVASECQYGGGGTLGGEFTSPRSIAIGGDQLYVADNGNWPIQKFDLDGNFERAWGKDVTTGGVTGFEICTVATNCKQGIQGAGNGELDLPNGVAATASFVYVADTDNHRINKYDTAGGFVRSWGKDVLSTGGSGGLEVCTLPGTCRRGRPAVSAVRCSTRPASRPAP